MNIDLCNIIDPPKKTQEPRGTLTFVEGDDHIPFDIQRVYCLYDVLGGSEQCGNLYPKIWRELDNFSPGSVCMVLASNKYDEDDCYRDYGEFMRARWQA